MKEIKKYHYSREDLCNLINTTTNKQFKPEQITMSSKGLVVSCEEEKEAKENE